MSQQPQVKPTPEFRGYYNRLRSRDHKFESETSARGDFNKEMYNNNVSYFEMTQDCNMGGSYLRNFYTLKDQEGVVWEEVPCSTPMFTFVEGDKIEVQSKSDANIHALCYLMDHFNCAKRPWCLYGEAKPQIQTENVDSTATQNSSVSSSDVQGHYGI